LFKKNSIWIEIEREKGGKEKGREVKKSDLYLTLFRYIMRGDEGKVREKLLKIFPSPLFPLI